MALLASKRFRAVRTLEGGRLPTMMVTKASGVTWPDGAIIIATTNLAVEAADGVEPDVIMGVALGEEKTSNTNLQALITPALPGIVFQGQIATGASGATVVTATTQRYTAGSSAYDLAVDSDIWYINVGASDDDMIVITDFVDPIGTAWGEVEFQIINSMFNPRITV